MAAALQSKLLEVAPSPQPASPLFNALSGEVRALIFTFALADYPDTRRNKRYKSTTIYARPSYEAPRRSDTDLLRTCRAVYQECWFLPYILKEQSHWLSHQDRAPPEYSVRRGRRRLRHRLREIVERQGEVQINSLRIFPQMWCLEAGELAKLIATPHLQFRSLTITIRHADWWWWEDDAPLKFEGSWIKAVCEVLPASVREIHIELESLERKKDQVDTIGKLMAQRWFFKRKDGVVLYADESGKSNEVTRWSGDSTWQGMRWVRDETSVDKIDYYVLDVVFRPRRNMESRGGTVCDKVVRTADSNTFNNNNNKLKLDLPDATPMLCHEPFISAPHRAWSPKSYHLGRLYSDSDAGTDSEDDEDSDESEAREREWSEFYDSEADSQPEQGQPTNVMDPWLGGLDQDTMFIEELQHIVAQGEGEDVVETIEGDVNGGANE